MRFDELILKMADDELRVRFHPELTVLSGLADAERAALADSILDAVAGGGAGGDQAALRYVDGTGRPATVAAVDGVPTARHEDGSPAEPPLAPAALHTIRATMLLDADGIGVAARPPRADDPPELREARANLEEVASVLDVARSEEQQVAGLRAELDSLDAELRLARDGAARRAYAEVLAQLERARAEMTTIESGTSGVEADRHLVAGAEEARLAVLRWQAADARVREMAPHRATQRLDDDDLAALAGLPGALPDDLADLVGELVAAVRHRDEVDQRLQVLAVATLPAPSQLVVAELGLLDQTRLWDLAASLRSASTALDDVRISLGGLGTEEGGPDPAVIEDLEAAHSALDEAEQAAEATRVTGVAGAGVGVAVAAAGAIGGLLLLVAIGLLVAAGVGIATLLVPKARVAKASAAEQAALARAGAPSYLGFHLRRVEASVDPAVRDHVEAILTEQRRAKAAWIELVGPEVDVHEVQAVEDEVRAYHGALRSLGGAADEIEELRRQLAEEAEPAVEQAWAVVAACCAPLGMDHADLDDPHRVEALAAERVELGHRARAQREVGAAEADERSEAAALDAVLLQLGFGTGELDARVGALEWAVIRAQEREEARAGARPIEVVAADLARLEAEAAQLRQPDWSGVTAAEADAPPIEELEERRAKVVAELERARPTVDVGRLADRHAALERRVTALEARLEQQEGFGDAGVIADVQQHLLAHLTSASRAGRHGDPVPVVLDEPLGRVSADRRWDLLDLILRLAERHQLVYLTDDAFVAAWARQRSADGALTLLEASPETV